MEKNNTPSVFSRNTFLGEVSCESSSDYSLPDYKADVRRILFTKAEAHPASAFIDSGEVTYSGIVNYSVVYLSADDKLEGLEFTSEYDGSAKMACEGAQNPAVDTRVANFALRLVGPRKLQAKATLASEISVIESVSLEVAGDGFTHSDALELSCLDILVGQTKRYCAPEREYAAKICELDGMIADEVRVIHSSANVKISDTALTADGFSVKGTVAVNALLESEGQSPVRAECEIPFDEVVSADEVSDGVNFFADGRVASLTVEVNPTEFGCDVTADVILEISAAASENSSASVVRDAYLTTASTDCEYSNFIYEQNIPVACDKLHCEVSVDREELGLASAREIVLCDAALKLQMEISEDGAELVGEVRFSGIAAEVDDGGRMNFVSFKHSAPVEKKLKLTAEDFSQIRTAQRASVEAVSAEIDRSQVVFSCDAALALVARERKNVGLLTSMCVVEDAAAVRDSSRVTVYYPEPTDTLFELAKKFRTTVKDIAVNNALAESVVNRQSDAGGLVGVKRLIIR